MSAEKCVMVDLPNTDVLLEVVGYGTDGKGSRFFHKRLFFPFRPCEGDEVYFDGDAMKPATVAIVDWFINGDKTSLQVRFETLGLDDKDIEGLLDAGWVEYDDPTLKTPVGVT